MNEIIEEAIETNKTARTFSSKIIEVVEQIIRMAYNYNYGINGNNEYKLRLNDFKCHNRLYVYDTSFFIITIKYKRKKLLNAIYKFEKETDEKGYNKVFINAKNYFVNIDEASLIKQFVNEINNKIEVSSICLTDII